MELDYMQNDQIRRGAPITGVLFGRLVKSLLAGRGDLIAAEQFARAKNWPEVTSFLTRAAVAPIDSAQASVWTAVSNDVVSFLRPLTLLGRMPLVRRVPFRTRILSHDVGGGGAWVAQGAPIPVTVPELSEVVTLDVKKVAGIRVITSELSRVATLGSDLLVAGDAIGGIVEAFDQALIDPGNSGDDATPRAITHPDYAAQIESSGNTVAAIDADLKRMLNALIDNGNPLTTAAWTMSPRAAVALSLIRNADGSTPYPGMTARGGTLLGLPVLTNASVVNEGSPIETSVALIEQSEVVVADDGAASVDLSTRATLRLDDAPAAGAQQLISLWQNGLAGVKVMRELNWTVRKFGAVACLRSVNWN